MNTFLYIYKVNHLLRGLKMKEMYDLIVNFSVKYQKNVSFANKPPRYENFASYK